MPPYPTNLTSGTPRDAAGLGPDRSIALVKGAAELALTAARADASLAALREALSEKDAAGPPAAPVRRVVGWLARFWRGFQDNRRHRRLSASLGDLNERQLMDIGLTPGDIDCIAAHRTLESLRDGTTHLWLSRGVM